jgi:DNA-binding IclR family transcriptional regulator
MATRSVSSASPSRDRPRSDSRSTDRVLDVLDLFVATGASRTLTEVSDSLSMPKSTAHGILHALRNRGYLAWDPVTKTYSISLQLVGRTSAARTFELIRVHARRHLKRLALALGETSVLVGYEGDQSIAIDAVEATRPVRYAVQLGERWPLHATGAGKLYLAQHSDHEVRQIVARSGLRPLTDSTIVDPEDLLRELAQARRAGWARQREEIIDDISGFAAPVLDPAGRVVASLVVTGPTVRMDASSERIAAELTRAAGELTAELGVQPVGDIA